MAIVMKIIVEQDDTGVGTRIMGEGSCTEAEAREAEFIHKAIITALESRKGFKRNDNDICEVKEIIKSTTEGNNNVH
ncbi:hypothetical protein LU631_07330 [Erwinia tracheiphila]|uniref:Uncharacterized protein n=1 Tax=Erwinia tracheiphila TaxID=65700 RepID=A0A0M2KKB2_9GAMM|nr:hypothetical protein [Erwinia tracheiphila]EOS93108.1 hypothetical protein ETR_21037 [Erwinia tracheiphila PSU-1]KKF37673.1 hypothetical protein SY86_23365 [Erwinia tracheiphila]UIA89070.1 hypothetical protein LU631_07330 [Erwinia tracheiphila]UIA97453.1 hypothetical protein LU633_06010 [Erwinia tracheiphila]